MPYRIRPPWAYHATYALRVALYISMASVGLLAALNVPDILDANINVILSQMWGYLTFASSILAALGVLYRKYRIEIVALPFIITGMLIRLTTLIHVSIEYGGRHTYIALILAVILLFALRLTELLAHASNLRKEHLQ